MFKRRMSVVLMLMLAVMLVFACVDAEKNAYRTLATAGETYHAAMQSVADLQYQGFISAAQREEINKYANYYYVAYQSAVDALEAYHVIQSTAAEEKLKVAMEQAANALAKLLEKVNVLVKEAKK